MCLYWIEMEILIGFLFPATLYVRLCLGISGHVSCPEPLSVCPAGPTGMYVHVRPCKDIGRREILLYCVLLKTRCSLEKMFKTISWKKNMSVLKAFIIQNKPSSDACLLCTAHNCGFPMCDHLLSKYRLCRQAYFSLGPKFPFRNCVCI